MTASTVLFIGAIVCVFCAATTSQLITANLDKRGIKTSLPLLRWYFFRNMRLYREETLKESGKVGPLFTWFVASINAAWILALLGLVVR